jgi:hypothetical protein
MHAITMTLIFLPLLLNQPTAPTWLGYTTQPESPLSGYTWHDWLPNCYQDQPYMPMVRPRDTQAQIQTLLDSRCNDGRALLFLNEPERADQDNITPAQGADLLHRLVSTSPAWRGPIVAGGTLVEDDKWTDDFITAYAQKYNRGKRNITALGGWHIHLYVNFEMPVSYAALTDSAIDAAVARQRDRLAAFIARRRAEGNSTSTLVTEAGLLIRWPQTDAALAQYQERMGYVMRAYDAMLRPLRPDVRSWHWYASYSGPTNCAHQGCAAWMFPTSNLTDNTGQLTPVGQTWLQLARVTH